MNAKIEAALKILLEFEYPEGSGDKPVVVTAPDVTGEEKLRIYAYGGLIGRICIDGSGTHRLLDDSYLWKIPSVPKKDRPNYSEMKRQKDKYTHNLKSLKEVYDEEEFHKFYNIHKNSYFNSENEQKAFDKTKKLFNFMTNKTDRLSVITSEEYLKLACEAAKNKFSQSKGNSGKERNEQFGFMKMHMKHQNAQSEKWCIIDAEFTPSSSWDVQDVEPNNIYTDSNSDKIGKSLKGKPDFIVYDKKSHRFGIIEFKFNNKSLNNINKHTDDYYSYFNVCNNERFRKEIERRIYVLGEHGLINRSIADDMSNYGFCKKPFIGFLFAADNKLKNGIANAKEYAGKIYDEAYEINKEYADNIYCLYAEKNDYNDIELTISGMKSIKDFTNSVELE